MPGPVGISRWIPRVLSLVDSSCERYHALRDHDPVLVGALARVGEAIRGVRQVRDA